MTRENRRTPSIQHLALDAAAHAADYGLVSELTREVVPIAHLQLDIGVDELVAELTAQEF